jgi:prealbumin domain-containing protein
MRSRNWKLLPVLAFMTCKAEPEVNRITQASSLPGSNFEIDTDANLKVDGVSPPALDWANVAETRKADTTSGPTDESFGQGAKEDTAVPSVVNGSIPPNKSDLKFFGVYQEGATSSGFLHLFWARVQNPSGTTNMDFEFNQNQCPSLTGCSANGITPLRTAGDLLITYDLSQGGTVPTISKRTWTGTAWGAATPLGTDAIGSINTSTISGITNMADGTEAALGTLDPFTFGEASIALSAIIDPNVCQTFGSAYLKSRSSDSFTAALKDFVPPVAVNITSCGQVKITKVSTKNDANGNPIPVAGAEFTLWVDTDPSDADTAHDPTEDTVTNKTCTTGMDGKCTIVNVLPGSYWAVESVVPTGYKAAADQKVTVVGTGDQTLTFANTPLSNITVSFQSQVSGAGATKANITCTGLDTDPPDSTPSAFDDTSKTFKDLVPNTSTGYVCTIKIDP